MFQRLKFIPYIMVCLFSFNSLFANSFHKNFKKHSSFSTVLKNKKSHKFFKKNKKLSKNGKDLNSENFIVDSEIKNFDYGAHFVELEILFKIQ